jgi:hypothetical protein
MRATQEIYTDVRADVFDRFSDTIDLARRCGG